MARSSPTFDAVESISISRMRCAFRVGIDFRKPLPVGLLDRHAAGWYTR